MSKSLSMQNGWNSFENSAIRNLKNIYQPSADYALKLLLKTFWKNIYLKWCESSNKNITSTDVDLSCNSKKSNSKIIKIVWYLKSKIQFYEIVIYLSLFINQTYAF